MAWKLLAKKISEEVAAAPLDGTELVPVVQGGENATTTTQAIADLGPGGGGTGAVDSVNTKTGAVVLTQDDVGDGTTYKRYTQAEKTKLSGVATGATANDTDAHLKDRANHTGTQPASTISDFSAAADARVAAAAGTTVASLSGGKVPSSQLPAVALTSVQSAANQSAMLALTTQEGDVVVRTDENKSYMRNAGTSGTMADFTLLNTPTDAVTSVNGHNGAVVLGAADVGAQPTDAQLTALAALADAAGYLHNDGVGNLSWGTPAGGGGGGQTLYDIVVDAAGGGTYTTIEAALAAATAGQTIYVKNGTYTPTTGTHTVTAAGVSIVGESPNGVVIDMTVPNPRPVLEFDGDYLTLRNLGFVTNFNAAIRVNGQFSTVAHCYSFSVSSGGGEWALNGSDLRLIGNYIQVGSSNGSLSVAGARAMATGNIFLAYGNANSSFSFTGEGSVVSGNIFDSNMSGNNGGQTRMVSLSGAGISFTGNTLNGAGGNHIAMRVHSLINCTITGNRFEGFSTGIEDYYGDASGVVVSGNSFAMSYGMAFGNGAAINAAGGGTNWSITGNTFTLTHSSTYQLGHPAIALGGNHHTCIGNNIDATWDYGITNNGDHNTIIGNVSQATNPFADGGTNTDTGAPAGGGGGAKRLTWSTMFENITRFDTTSGGTGAAAPQVNSGGVYFDTGSTNAGYGWIGLSLPFAMGLPIWDLNPHMLMACNWPGTSGSWESYTTIGPSGRPDGAYPITNTQYAGFHIIRSAGVGTVYAVHSDGVNPEVATDITSVALAPMAAGSNAAMEVRVTSGSKIDFYVNGTLVATHTTNLPSGHNNTYDRFWELSLKASGVGATPWAYVSTDSLVISCDEAA